MSVPDVELVSQWSEVDAAAQAIKNGVQKSQMSQGVQTSLGKADSALQPTTGVTVAAQAAKTPGMTAPVGIDEYGRLFADTFASIEAKDALLALLAKCAYVTDDAQVDYDRLVAALSAKLDYIVADYEQDRPIYDTDSLDAIKVGDDLIVTAYYDDGTHIELADSAYTLSGTLTAGTSTITVTYGGKTTTFDVTVTHRDVPRGYTQYDYVRYAGTEYSGTGDPKTQIKTPEFANLNQNIIEFDFMPYSAQTGSAAGVIGGQKQGTSGNGSQIAVYARTDTQRVSCFSHGSAIGIDNNPNVQQGKVAHVKINPGASSPATLIVDELSQTAAWTDSQTINTNIGYCGKYMSGTTSSFCTLKPFAAIGILKVFTLSNELVGKYVPCVRDSDNQIGIWDTVTETFYTTDTAAAATVGATGCVWAVGNWT